MKSIEVKILNPDSISDAEKMMVAMARLTQRGNSMATMDDLTTLFNKSYAPNTVEAMMKLPHATIRRFNVLNVAIVGASRRFLAQITRHQAGVTFMSGSLQYSDYSDAAKFMIPYEIIVADAERQGNAQYVENYHAQQYFNSCNAALNDYEKSIVQGVPHDAAAYMMPHGLRNVLVISANVEAWRHMISQRVCNRNSAETQYVMLRIWEELYKLNPTLFEDCGAPCTTGKCPEGKMSCYKPIIAHNPTVILDQQFKYIRSGTNEN